MGVGVGIGIGVEKAVDQLPIRMPTATPTPWDIVVLSFTGPSILILTIKLLDMTPPAGTIACPVREIDTHRGIHDRKNAARNRHPHPLQGY